jgi:hypothetical protein
MTLSGGSSSGSGGGIENFGTLTIKNSTISGNTTAGGGGGVNNYIGTVAITNSTISDNTANSSGGGVANYHGTVAITNSTISDNTANSSGGGVYNAFGYNGYFGGGGRVTITNSTISGNRANQGGGILNGDSPLSAALTLNDSLVAGNQAGFGPEINNESIGTVAANNFNLFGVNGNAGVTGFKPGRNDIVPAAGVQLADIVGPLGNNGGPTQTHALVAGSPAIDAANPIRCRDNSGAFLLTDQRGFVRHFDGNNDGKLRCDIGAVEFGAETVAPPLVFAAPRLPDAEVGVPYTSPPLVSGGVPPYSLHLVTGAFPPGLTDDPVNGTIIGTPTSFRSQNLRVQITDQDGTSATGSFSIRVLRALGITTRVLNAGIHGRAYRAILRAVGGKTPYNWSLFSGSLPQGLSLNSSTGLISGVPTEIGIFDLVFEVSDSLGGVIATPLTLTIK